MSHATGTLKHMGNLYSGTIRKPMKNGACIALDSGATPVERDGPMAMDPTRQQCLSWSMSGVKRLAQVSLVLLAMVLYVANVPTATAEAGNTPQGAGSWQAGGDPFGPSAFLLQQPSTSQSLGHSFARSPVPPAKERVTPFPAMVRAAARSVETTFARMVLGEWYQLLELRRCALLFPFHWFW